MKKNLFFYLLIIATLLSRTTRSEVHIDNNRRVSTPNSQTPKVDCRKDIAVFSEICRVAPPDRKVSEPLVKKLVTLLPTCTDLPHSFEGLRAAATWEAKRITGDLDGLKESIALREIIEAIRIEKLEPPNRPWPERLTACVREFEQNAKDPQLRAVASILRNGIEGQLSGSAERLTEVLANAPLFEPDPVHPLQNLCTSLPERVHQSYSFDPRHALWELVLLFSLEDPKTPHDRVKLDETRTPVLPPLAAALGKMLQRRDPSGLRVVPLSHLLIPYVDARLPVSGRSSAREEAVELLAQNLASQLVPHPSPLFNLWGKRTSLVLDRPADGSKVEMLIPRSDLASNGATIHSADYKTLSDGPPQEKPVLFGTAIHTSFKLNPRESKSPLKQTAIILVGSNQYTEGFEFLLAQPAHKGSELQEKLKKRTGPSYQEFDADGVRKGLLVSSDSSVEVLIAGYTGAGFKCQKLNTLASIQDRVERLLAPDQKAGLDYLLLDSIRPFDPSNASLVPEVAAWECNKPKEGATPEQSITLARYKDKIPQYPLSAERSALALDGMISRKRGVKPLLALSAARGSTTSQNLHTLAFSILHDNTDFVSIRESVPSKTNRSTPALSNASKMLLEGWDYARTAKEFAEDIRDFSWMEQGSDFLAKRLVRTRHTFDPAAFSGRLTNFDTLPTELPADAVALLRQKRIDQSEDQELKNVAENTNTSALTPRLRFEAWNTKGRLERLELDNTPNWIFWPYLTDSLEDLHPQALTINGKSGFRPTLRALADSGVSGKAAQLALMQLEDTQPAYPPIGKMSQEMHRLALEVALSRRTPTPSGWLDPSRDRVLQETLAKRASDPRNIDEQHRSVALLLSLESFNGQSEAANILAQALKRDPYLIRPFASAVGLRTKPIPNASSFEDVLVSLASHDDSNIAEPSKRTLAALGLRLDLVVPAMIEAKKRARAITYDTQGLIDAAARGNDAAIESLLSKEPDIFRAYQKAKQISDAPARQKIANAIRNLGTDRVPPEFLESLLEQMTWQDGELLISFLGRKDYKDRGGFALSALRSLSLLEGQAPPDVATALRQYASMKTPNRPTALLTLAKKDPKSAQWAGEEIKRELDDGDADYAFANAVFQISKHGFKIPSALPNLKSTLRSIARKPLKPQERFYPSIDMIAQASPAVRERVAEYLLSETKDSRDPQVPYLQWLAQLGETGERMFRTTLRSLDVFSEDRLLSAARYFRASPRWERLERELLKSNSTKAYRMIDSLRYQ